MISLKKMLFPGREHLRRLLLLCSIAVIVLGLSCLLYVHLVATEIDAKIQQLSDTRSTEFYGTYPPLKPGQIFKKGQFRELLDDQGYTEKSEDSDLVPGEYYWTRGKTPRELHLSRPPFTNAGYAMERQDVVVTFDEMGAELGVKEIKRADADEVLPSLDAPPKKIAAFYAGRIRTQSPVDLSDMPVSVRHAVMAIEDVKFLEHPGVSLRSTVRALWKDLRARRWVEGGSTITQQLMKNLFFSNEKALNRKIKEAVYAFVAESRHTKEALLEAYLNEIYMGQLSTHEIHGVAEGALYYFNRNISDLTLAQSALIAAIIQAPNAQDPRKYPERAILRRNLVLKKMRDAEFILPDEYDEAVREPLGVTSSDRSLDDVDYFLDLLLARLPDDLRVRLDTQRLTVYTSLNPYLQASASNALRRNLQRIQTTIPQVKKLDKQGIHLQSALIAIDVPNCSVLALQGGRSYRTTQFNRVLQGQRQPGSLFKPFVYLAAFNPDIVNPPFTPVTQIPDQPFEWAYDKQVWKPKNYDNEFRGTVTARQALEFSLNVPTAVVAKHVGVDAIVETLRRVGIKSPLPAVPSLSLGSAEVTPIELAAAYTTLAGLGKTCEFRPYFKIFDEGKNLIFDNLLVNNEVIPAPVAYQTVQVLKGVFTEGTAKNALASGLPLAQFAGKTGTTNEYKDAWFVGFSSELLVLVWVGFDEDAKLGLTGAAAALPLWTDFLGQARPFISGADFPVPDGIASYDIDPTTGKLAGPHCPSVRPEYFLKGTAPDNCHSHPQ